MNEISSKFNIVMVIDDNNIDMYITSRLVSKNNFAAKTLQFSSGREAFEYLTENKNNLSMIPEIIFVDIHMPQMSGFDFMDLYNSLPEDLKTYTSCYIISSTIDQRDIKHANADKNVVAFRKKPLDSGFLENIFRN